MQKYKNLRLSERWIDLKTADVEEIVKKYRFSKVKNFTKLSGGVVNLNIKIETISQAYVFRIYRYKSRFNIETELNLIDFLRKNDFPTPCYFKDKSGNRIQKLNSRYGVLFKFVGGVKIKEKNISISHVQKIGALLGNLHLITRDFSQGKNRWSGDIKGIKALYRKRKNEIKITNPQLYGKIKRQLDVLLMAKERFNIPKGLVHSDMRIENLIFSEQGEVSALLDFDNFYYGYLLVDITTAIYFCCFEKNKLNKKKMEVLISVYQSHRCLSQREKELIMRFLKFVALKHALYGGLICVEGNQRFGERFALRGINRFKSLSKIE